MLRVVQWGTGNTGKRTAQAVHRAADLELVGCYTTSDSKDGVDVGTICGTEPIGVFATKDAEAIYKLPADCVLYMTMKETDVDGAVDEICRLLESGKNVVCTAATILIYPKALGKTVVDRIEAACRAGGTTFHGAGIEPGWAGTTLPLIVSGAMGRIDWLHIQEFLDYRSYSTAVSMFDAMGYGREPQPVPPTEISLDQLGSYAGPLMLLADALGVTIDHVVYECEVSVAESDYEVAAGPIKAGAVSGKRYAFTAFIGGKPKIKVEHFNRAGDPGPAGWPLGPGFFITARGEPCMKLSVDLGIHGGEDTDEGIKLAAAQIVHSIRPACAADSGIRTVLDLPPVVGYGMMSEGGAIL